MKAKLIDRDEFKSVVELWRSKGHENVVRAEFNGVTINLFVQDYVYPEREYFLNVIDSRAVDACNLRNNDYEYV